VTKAVRVDAAAYATTEPPPEYEEPVMPILFTCKCGKPLKARDELAGKKIKCPHCGILLTAPAPAPVPAAKAAEPPPGAGTLLEGAISIEELPWSEEAARVAVSSPTPTDSPASGPATAPIDESEKRYKVVTTKDMGFVAKFDAGRLEEALNQHWKRGWAVRSVVRITVPAHGGMHDELVFILERFQSGPHDAG
jgi:hypothetical protein